MENKSLLVKLKSEYIFDNIASYIKDDCFICKLFIHSKYFQKKLDLELLYLEKYLTKRIIFNDYLYRSRFVEENKELSFLQDELNETIKEYNLNDSVIQDVIKNYYKKYPIKEFDLGEEDSLIEFESPFFDSLSKLENFSEIFIPYLDIYRIQHYNIEDEYIKKFDELHKSNINISSIKISRIENNNDLDYFSKFKINLNLLKNVFIGNVDDIIIIKNFFSLFTIKNNLIHLELGFFKNQIEPSLFEGINSFTSLKYLFLEGLIFKKTFIFKLYNLEKIDILRCENFKFEENSLANLKILKLRRSLIIADIPLYLPNLEEIELSDDSDIYYVSKIDFKSLINLKKFSGHANYFILLKDIFLEEVEFLADIENNAEKEKEVIEKLIRIKTLKNIQFNFSSGLNDDLMLSIKGENYSVTSIFIDWNNFNEICKLDNFQKKFPNLRNFKIKYLNCRNEKNDEKLEIKEDKNSKINDINIKAENGSKIILSLPEYDKLESIDLYFSKIINNNLPFFDINNKITFKSLVFLKLELDGFFITIDTALIYNIFNNISNIPNLKHLILKAEVSEYVTNYSYEKFINKILNMKLIKKIYIRIDNPSRTDYKYKWYTTNELKQIYTNINFNKFHLIKITKLSKSELSKSD